MRQQSLYFVISIIDRDRTIVILNSHLKKSRCESFDLLSNNLDQLDLVVIRRTIDYRMPLS